MQKKLWQDLNDQQAEQLSGGLNRLVQEFQAELVTVSATTATPRQPEAEGKIRGTLLLSF